MSTNPTNPSVTSPDPSGRGSGYQHITAAAQPQSLAKRTPTFAVLDADDTPTTQSGDGRGSGYEPKEVAEEKPAVAERDTTQGRLSPIPTPIIAHSREHSPERESRREGGSPGFGGRGSGYQAVQRDLSPHGSLREKENQSPGFGGRGSGYQQTPSGRSSRATSPARAESKGREHSHDYPTFSDNGGYGGRGSGYQSLPTGKNSRDVILPTMVVMAAEAVDTNPFLLGDHLPRDSVVEDPGINTLPPAEAEALVRQGLNVTAVNTHTIILAKQEMGVMADVEAVTNPLLPPQNTAGHTHRGMVEEEADTSTLQQLEAEAQVQQDPSVMAANTTMTILVKEEMVATADVGVGTNRHPRQTTADHPRRGMEEGEADISTPLLSEVVLEVSVQQDPSITRMTILTAIPGAVVAMVVSGVEAVDTKPLLLPDDRLRRPIVDISIVLKVTARGKGVRIHVTVRMSTSIHMAIQEVMGVMVDSEAEEAVTKLPSREESSTAGVYD
ncbi:MAG: hypothetical protein Q9187_005966 [Circinaria calcarea]